MPDNDSLEGFTPEEISQMASTYQAILKDPRTREFGLRATKALNPKASIPEIDLKDAARAEFKKVEERQAKLEDEIRLRDARDRVNEERGKLREAGFTKDEVSEIEKVMIDEKIPSYETAAKYFKGQRQIAQPTPHSPTPAVTYSLPTDALAAAKGGKAGLSKFARETAAAALNDIQAGRIKLH